MPDMTLDAVSVGGPEALLTRSQVEAFIGEQLARVSLEGRSVCVLVPDATRVCPLPLLVGAVHRAVHGRVSRLTVLVALGTHAPMSEEATGQASRLRTGRARSDVSGTTVRNHEWWDPATFAALGTIPASRIEELSDGRLSVDVDVRLNRAVVEHDVALVVGPVLPHEVVGMSGGNKYFFPGVGRTEIIDVSHWLGALITSAEIIGTTELTPVRALINDGAALIPAQRLALCVVTGEEPSGGGTDPEVVGLHSMSFGDPVSAWASAAAVSAATHITYLDAPVRRVLSIVPEMYDEMWTGAKGFYKVEPVVADGGEVIVYAPHISELASSHPQIHDIGFHCPGLLREPVGPVQGRALGGPGPLDTSAWGRHL